MSLPDGHGTFKSVDSWFAEDIFLYDLNAVIYHYTSHGNKVRILAKNCEMSISTLYRIRKGEKVPSMYEFMTLCNMFNLNPVKYFDVETQVGLPF